MSSLRLFRKYDSLQQYRRDLETFDVHSLEDLKENKERFYSTSMLLFSMMNDLLSIAEEVLDIQGWEMAENYHDLFKVVRKHDIITPQEEQKCFKLVTLRNALAHEYDDFDEESVYELREMVDFMMNLAERLVSTIKTG